MGVGVGMGAGMKAGVGDAFSKGLKPSWGSGPTTGWKHQRDANNLMMN